MSDKQILSPEELRDQLNELNPKIELMSTYSGNRVKSIIITEKGVIYNGGYAMFQNGWRSSVEMMMANYIKLHDEYERLLKESARGNN